MYSDKRARLRVASVLLCVVLGGCKPSPTTSSACPGAGATSPAGASVACAALTADKASAALNVKASLVESKADADGQSFCTYKFGGGGTARIQVVIGSDAQAQYDALKNGVTDSTDVAGVGDKAFASGQGFGAIKADHFVSVIGGLPGDANSQKKLTQAMLAAL